MGGKETETQLWRPSTTLCHISHLFNVEIPIPSHLFFVDDIAHRDCVPSL